MPRNKILCLLTMVLATALVTSCDRSENTEAGPALSAPQGGIPVVYTDNYPLAYFAGRIGGPEVKVVFPGPGDEDPAFWQPDAGMVSAYQSADLILLNGATYAKWAAKASLPESRVVDTSAGFSDRYIEVKEGTSHSHGGEGEHSHGGIAFTTWMDFQQALLQADAIREAFQKLRPEQMELFALNFDQLKTDLLALDAAMTAAAAKAGQEPLVASHPVYQYWARRYKLNVEAVLWEPETVPTDAQMEELKALLSEHPAKRMIWEGDPAAESVEKLKALGISSVVIDPCGNVPDEGTWLDVMKKNVSTL
jgi:zinc transport system substrate-binding protein